MDQKSKADGHISQFIRIAETSLFGTLFVISKRHDSHSWRTIGGMVVKMAQMLTFVLAAGFAWKPTLDVPRVALGLSTIQGYMPYLSQTAYFTLFYLSLAWTSVFVGLIIWASVSFYRNKFAYLWPLRVLRMIGLFSANVLYIPLFSLLMSVMNCGNSSDDPDFWREAGYTCYHNAHLAHLVISLVLAGLFFLCCALFSLIFYDSNFPTRNIAAKAHGRIDLLMLIVKTVLVVVVETFADQISDWVKIVLLSVAAVVWFTAYVGFLPFYAHSMNQLQCAFAAVFAYSVACLLLQTLNTDKDAAPTLYFGFILAAVFGVAAANYRVKKLLRTPISRLRDALEVEIVARLNMHNALFGDHTEKRTHVVSLELDATSKNGEGKANAELDDAISHPTSGAAAPATGLWAAAKPAQKPTSNVSTKVDAFDEEDKENGRVILPLAVVQENHKLYRDAVLRFPGSAILHVFFARLYKAQGNRHMQMSHLLQAERRSPGLDVSFLVYQARKLAEDDIGNGKSGLDRVAFEKFSVDARKHVQRAAIRQLSFWQELLDPLPDLSRLHRMSTDMNSAIQSAETAFSELFAINAQSLAALRLYASFNLLVLLNSEKAGVLFAEAERLEDQKTRDHSQEGNGMIEFGAESELDVMSDTTAIFTIAGSHRSLGIIISANANAAKLFGYSRLQLERRNVFTLLSEPLSSRHESLLRSYVDSGEGAIMATSPTLGITKNGVLLPLLVSIREPPPSDAAPTFLVMMRDIRTQDQHMLLREDGTIVGASSGSCQILGVSPTDVMGGEVRISEFCEEWSLMQRELRSSRGASLRICRLSGDRSSPDSGTSFTAGCSSALDASGMPIPYPSASSREGGGAQQPPRRASLIRDRRGSVQSQRTGIVGGGSSSVRVLNIGDDSAGVGGCGGNPPVTWIQGRLQDMLQKDGSVETFFALHWHRMPTDSFTLASAEKRRRSVLVQSNEAAAVCSGSGSSTLLHGDLVHKNTKIISSTSAGHELLPPFASLPSNLKKPREPLTAKETQSDPRSTSTPMTTSPRLIFSPQWTPPATAAAPSRDPLALSLPGQIQHPVARMRGLPHSHSAEAASDHEYESDGEHDSLPIAAALGFPSSTAASVHASYRRDSDGNGGNNNNNSTYNNSSDGGFQPRGLGAALHLRSNRQLLQVESLPSVKLPPPAHTTTTAAGDDLTDRRKRRSSSTGFSTVGLLTEDTLDEREVGLMPRRGVNKSMRKGESQRVVVGAEVGDGDDLDLSQTHSDEQDRPSSSHALSQREPKRREEGVLGEAPSFAKRHPQRGDRSIHDDGTSVEDDRKSAGGGTFASNVSVGHKQMARLRRTLLSESQPLLKGLLLLRAASLLITGLSSALAISITLIMTTRMTAYHSNLLYTEIAGLRVIDNFNLIINVEALAFAGRGLIELAPDQEAYHRSWIEGNASSFMTLHRQAYALVQGTPGVEVYEVPWITITYYNLADSGSVGTQRQLNLFDDGATLISNCLHVANTPLMNLSSKDEPIVKQLLIDYISGGNGHESIHDSMMIGDASSLSTMQTIRSTQIAVFGGMAGLLVILGMFVFLPILLQVEATKDTIVKRFIDLPQLVRLVLAQQAEKRVKELRHSYTDGENDEEDDESEDGDLTERAQFEAADGDEEAGGGVRKATDAAALSNMLHGNVGFNAGTGGEAFANDDDPDWPSVLHAAKQLESKLLARRNTKMNARRSSFSSAAIQCSGVCFGRKASSSSKSSAPTSSLRYKKSWRSLCILLTKFVGPLLAVLVFFAVQFAMSLDTLDKTLLMSISATTAMSRTTCTRELLCDLQNMMTQRGDHKYSLNAESMLADTANCINEANRALSFGSDEESATQDNPSTLALENGMNIYLSADVASTIFQAKTGDACPFIVNSGLSSVTMAECEAFSGGIVTQGITVLLREYLRRISLIGDRRQRARIATGDNILNTGYIIPASEYNYTVDMCDGVAAQDSGCIVAASFTMSLTDIEQPSLAPDPTFPGDCDANWTAEVVALGLTGVLPYSAQAELNSDDLLWVTQVDALFLSPAFLTLAQLYCNTGMAMIMAFNSFSIIFLYVFVVSFVVYIVLVYLPALSAENRDIQAKRTMLLFLPPQVVMSTKSLRGLVNDILAEDAMLGRGSGIGTATIRAAAEFSKHARAIGASDSRAEGDEEGGRGGGGGGGGKDVREHATTAVVV